MGTQRDPVTSLRTCWRALPCSPAAVRGTPRLHFYGCWQGDERRGSNSSAQVRRCGSTAGRTFVCARDVRVVGSGVSDTLGGVHDGAGLSLRQFGGRGQRNVVVHQSVPVKLYVHHLEGRQLGVTQTLCKKTFINSNLQSLLQASAAPCTFCPAVGQGKKIVCCSIIKALLI